MSDALERLLNSNNMEMPHYTAEERMESVDDDDFLESMSNSSRNALLQSIDPQSSIQEVVLDNSEPETPVIENPITEDVSETIIMPEEPVQITEPEKPEPKTVIPKLPDDIAEAIKASENIEEPKKVETPSENNSVPDVLFNSNNEEKKRRGRPKQQITETLTTTNNANKPNTTFDPIMNRLALDIIKDLQNKKFKVNGFDDNLMQIVFDYMRTKF